VQPRDALQCEWSAKNSCIQASSYVLRHRASQRKVPVQCFRALTRQLHSSPNATERKTVNLEGLQSQHDTAAERTPHLRGARDKARGRGSTPKARTSSHAKKARKCTTLVSGEHLATPKARWDSSSNARRLSSPAHPPRTSFLAPTGLKICCLSFPQQLWRRYRLHAARTSKQHEDTASNVALDTYADTTSAI